MFTRHKMKENALALSLIASCKVKQPDDVAIASRTLRVEEAIAALCQISTRRRVEAEEQRH